MEFFGAMVQAWPWFKGKWTGWTRRNADRDIDHPPCGPRHRPTRVG